MSGQETSRLDRLPADKRALFLKLRAERDRRADHPAVPLRPGSGPARLVLLPPSGGALFCYTPLVRALRDDIDVIGFAADPGDRDLDLHERLGIVADRVLASLARVADPGSCLLAGWSHGGVLAFEMARKHAAAGGTAPHVVLIDCVYLGDRPLEDESKLRRRFLYDLIRVAGGDDAAYNAALEAFDPDRDGLRPCLTAAGVDITLTDAELAERYRIFRDCSLGLQAYAPPAPYAGDITLVVTQLADAIERRWTAVVTGRKRTVRVPGDHFTLFRPPVLATVVGEIEAAAGPAPAASR
jgi:thioesterase domain-containing protein